jgi:hypothetical protein
MSLIPGDLVLDLLDTVSAGLVVIDVVASDSSVVFFFGLAKGANTGRPVPRRVKGIRSSWSLFVAVDDVPAAGGDEVRLHDLGPFGVVVLACELRTFGQVSW